MLAHINNINEAIQFTVESENENGELPYLDCPIKRNPDGTLDSTVYRKFTNTGRYLNFHFCHASNQARVYHGPLLKSRNIVRNTRPAKN